MSGLSLTAITAGDQRQLDQMLAILAEAEQRPLATLRAWLAARIFDQLFGEALLHPQLAQQLQPLRKHFAHISLQLLLVPDDLLHGQLAELCTQFSRWTPAEGDAGQQYLQRLTERLPPLVAALQQGPAGLTAVRAAVKSLLQWQAAEARRAALAEARLCDEARQQLGAEAANRAAALLINQYLKGHQLPVALQEPLQLGLLPALSQTVQAAGETDHERAPFWQLWQRQLYFVGQLFPAPGQSLADQQMYEVIPGLLEKLDASLDQGGAPSPGYQHWIDALSQCLLQAIQKQPLECALFHGFDAPEAPGAVQTPSLAREHSNLQPGQWFLFDAESGQTLRLKLSLRQLSGLLFTDRTGRRALEKHLQDFSLCLSAGVARPLPACHIADLLQQCVAPLVARANQLQARKHQAEALRQQQLREQSARKAQAEADRLAAQQGQRAGQDSVALDAEQTRQAEALLAQLHVGAWLELNTGDKPQEAKLSVILPATGKYIFVDALGHKRLELARADLHRALALGQARILHKGHNFEDQLARVIQGLRKEH